MLGVNRITSFTSIPTVVFDDFSVPTRSKVDVPDVMLLSHLHSVSSSSLIIYCLLFASQLYWLVFFLNQTPHNSNCTNGITGPHKRAEQSGNRYSTKDPVQLMLPTLNLLEHNVENVTIHEISSCCWNDSCWAWHRHYLAAKENPTRESKSAMRPFIQNVYWCGCSGEK